MGDSSKTIHLGETTDGPGGEGPSGEPVNFPIRDVLTGRTAVLGKSGSGKSNTGGLICERLLAEGYPVFVIDVEGEYRALKQEFEVLHAGAEEESDVVVGPEHADRLADLALGDSVPVVLDVSGYLEDERDELVEAVVRSLFEKEKDRRRPFLLVIEEIHEYIPEQGGLSDVGRRIKKVAKRGRKRGLGIMGMSQRPADVDKTFLTQADTVVWHRLTWDNDRTVVRRILSKEYSEAVADLDPGEGFVDTDWSFSDVRRVQFERKETVDLGRTPDLEEQEDPDLKSVSSDLADQLQDISKQKRREKNRVDQLEDELQEKADRIEELEDEVERARQVADVAEQISQAVTREARAAVADDLDLGVDVDLSSFEGELSTDVIRAEVMELRDEKQEAEARVEDLREERDRLRERVEELDEDAERGREADALANLRDELVELLERHGDVLQVETDDRVERFRDRIRDLEDELADVREERDRLQDHAPDVEAVEDVARLLGDPTVRERVGDVSRYDKETCIRVLENVASGDGVRATDVEPFVDVGLSSVRDILGELAAAGMVRQEDDPDDARANIYFVGFEALREAKRAGAIQEQIAEAQEGA